MKQILTLLFVCISLGSSGQFEREIYKQISTADIFKPKYFWHGTGHNIGMNHTHSPIWADTPINPLERKYKFFLTAQQVSGIIEGLKRTRSLNADDASTLIDLLKYQFVNQPKDTTRR